MGVAAEGEDGFFAVGGAKNDEGMDRASTEANGLERLELGDEGGGEDALLISGEKDERRLERRRRRMR